MLAGLVQEQGWRALYGEITAGYGEGERFREAAPGRWGGQAWDLHLRTYDVRPGGRVPSRGAQKVSLNKGECLMHIRPCREAG